MQLLNTIAKPNSLVAQALDFVAVYSEPTVSLYKKLPDTNELSLVTEYTLAGVKRLALSDNGQVLSAQTATQTHRLSVVGSSPYDIVGPLATADQNYTVVLTPTAVQVIRETVVNMNTTLTVAERVVCGAKTFMVYSRSRYILGSYTAGLQAPVTPANPIVHIAHTGGDKFAIFYANGSVELNGKTRPLLSLLGHRDSGRHVVANNGTHEYSYMKNAPLTDPVRVRPFTPPPIPNEMFTSVTGGAPLTFTIERTLGASVEEPPSIGAASVIIAHGGQDNVKIVLDQTVNLAATDWTLEWASLNLSGADGNYYSEISLLPTTGNNGLTARYGDGGFQNRLQFGGRVDLASNNYNVSLTKAAAGNVLKRYTLVKQGTNVEVYIDDVRQNLAAGTSSTYNLTTFPLDTDLSAIKHIVIGASTWGGYAMGAIRGPVKLTLAAKRPPQKVFSLFNADGTLSSGATNTGATVANNLITVTTNQYLSIPSTAAMVPRLQDFVVECEVLFVSVPPPDSSINTSLQGLLYWGTFANPAQPVNMDVYYVHTAPARLVFLTTNTSPSGEYLRVDYVASLGRWYNFRWVRKDGVLTCYIDGVAMGSVPYAFDITYDTAQPIVIGRRKGGSAGEVIWNASLQMRKLSITVG